MWGGNLVSWASSPVPAEHHTKPPGRAAQLLCVQGITRVPYELFLTLWNCQQPFHSDSGCDRSNTASLASDGKCNFLILKSQNLQYAPESLLRNFQSLQIAKAVTKCTHFLQSEIGILCSFSPCPLIPFMGNICFVSHALFSDSLG